MQPRSANHMGCLQSTDHTERPSTRNISCLRSSGPTKNPVAQIHEQSRVAEVWCRLHSGRDCQGGCGPVAELYGYHHRKHCSWAIWTRGCQDGLCSEHPSKANPATQGRNQVSQEGVQEVRRSWEGQYSKLNTPQACWGCTGETPHTTKGKGHHRLSSPEDSRPGFTSTGSSQESYWLLGVTVVEGLECKVSNYLRRWLVLSRSLSSIGLYGNNNKLRLPFKVVGTGIVLRTGRKWRAAEAVQPAEARLKHKNLVGSVAQGRAGLWIITSTQYGTAIAKRQAGAGARGGTCFSRGRAGKQYSGHATAGCLDEVGTGDRVECYLAAHLEVEPTEDQVLDSGSLWCPPQPLKPVRMGQVRDTCMPFVF